MLQKRKGHLNSLSLAISLLFHEKVERNFEWVKIKYEIPSFDTFLFAIGYEKVLTFILFLLHEIEHIIWKIN